VFQPRFSQACCLEFTNHDGTAGPRSDNLAHRYLIPGKSIVEGGGRGVTRVEMGYDAKRGWIGSLKMFDHAGKTVLDWQMDTTMHAGNKGPLTIDKQEAPNKGEKTIDGDGREAR
jgi:hypothetical protein